MSNERKKRDGHVLSKEANDLLAAGITTRERFETALPLLFEVRGAASGLRLFAKNLEEQSRQICRAAAAYAKDHKTVLPDGLCEVREGIQSGEVEVDGVVYRLTVSPGAFKRISGDNVTQSFLGGLPKKWTRAKLELATAELANIDPDELHQHDLAREVKNEWSVVESAA